MTINRQATAGDVINQSALEIGLSAVNDPFSSQDDSFTQLVALLNTAGDELSLAYQWEFLTKAHTVDASEEVAPDTGVFTLPPDFLYYIPQSGWERTNRVPLFGPLSAQDWSYLEGRKLASNTIYASFRIQNGEMHIFPHPTPNGLEIVYEYQSKNWVIDNSTGTPTESSSVQRSADIVKFDKLLVTRYLRMKYLEVKGLDSTKASDDFSQAFTFLTQHDKGGGEILRAGGRGRGFPYLDTYRNTPDTNYGGLI